MTYSSTKRHIFLIFVFIAILVSIFMFDMDPIEISKSFRAGSTLAEKSAGELTKSTTYNMDTENARGSVLNDIVTLRREVTLLREDLKVVQRSLQQMISQGDEIGHQELNQSNAEVMDGSLSLDLHNGLAEKKKKLEKESEDSVLAQIEANEAALRKESEDPAWSGVMIDRINLVIDNKKLSATLVQNIECRTTLCRIEVRNKDPQARAIFEGQFIRDIAELLPQVTMRTVENEDGSTTTVLYLARNGYELPSEL